jgi:hypothetical protein
MATHDETYGAIDETRSRGHHAAYGGTRNTSGHTMEMGAPVA